MILNRKWRMKTTLIALPFFVFSSTVIWNPSVEPPEPRLLEIPDVVSSHIGVFGVNNAGLIVGTGSDRSMGCYFCDVTRSAAVGCIDRLHSGRDINNRGEIIGTILESDREKTAIWSPDYGVRILNDLMPKCVAFGINDHGAIVGFYPEKTGGLRAFQWSEQGGFVDLSELTGRRFTRANAINNACEIAGQIVSDGAERAILWRPGLGFVDLHPHDADVSSAFGLNDRGQVVGYCRMERGSFAFVWSKEHGMINLNQLLSPSSDWSFQRAVAINDNGEIVGLGRRSEKFRSFFLKL